MRMIVKSSQNKIKSTKNCNSNKGDNDDNNDNKNDSNINKKNEDHEADSNMLSGKGLIEQLPNTVSVSFKGKK
jgi:hypothetical protein